MLSWCNIMVISNFLISYTMRLLGMWEESHKDELSFMGWDKLLTRSPQITQTWPSEINLSGGELNYLAFPTSLHLINWLCFRFSLIWEVWMDSLGTRVLETNIKIHLVRRLQLHPAWLVSLVCFICHFCLLKKMLRQSWNTRYSIIYICPNSPLGKRNTFMSVSPYSQLIHSTIHIYAKVIWW